MIPKRESEIRPERDYDYAIALMAGCGLAVSGQQVPLESHVKLGEGLKTAAICEYQNKILGAREGVRMRQTVP